MNRIDCTVYLAGRCAKGREGVSLGSLPLCRYTAYGNTIREGSEQAYQKCRVSSEARAPEGQLVAAASISDEH